MGLLFAHHMLSTQNFILARFAHRKLKQFFESRTLRCTLRYPPPPPDYPTPLGYPPVLSPPSLPSAQKFQHFGKENIPRKVVWLEVEK